MPQVLKDRVLVSIEKAPAEYISPGGIILQNLKTEEDEATSGTVAAVGPQVEQIKEGDVVIFPPHAGSDIQIEGKDYLTMRESEVYYIKPNK